MARPAIEIVSDAKRKVDKERKRDGITFPPFSNAQFAAKCATRYIMAVTTNPIG